MSHLTELKPKFLQKSEKELIACLQTVFGEGSVEVHDTPVAVQGYDQRGGGQIRKANIIIRKEAVKSTFRNNGWNDIGYARQEDGTYSLYADPSDFPQTSQDKIAQDYNERVAAKSLKAKGYTLKREVMKDGVVKLVATKYG